MTTLADLVYIDDTGYHFADFPTFLQWRQDQYRAIYGADVYLEPDSQDGQLLAAQAQADYDTAAQGASTYNSFSPATGQGLGLARNVKINGITKRLATNSTVDLVIVGQAGTTITNGFAQDTLSQKWKLPISVVIPGGGTITVTATADQPGAVGALPNTITKIFNPTLGWQTVNNPAAATLGQPVETDAELRLRQSVSTANPSLSLLNGTEGAVANVTGVTDVQGYENDTDSTNADTLPPHSISIVVSGGDSMDIANVIALHKTPGTQTYGTTTENVTDAHGMPLAINFYRPTVPVVGVQITLTAGASWSSDYLPLIKQAVADAINAFGIGNDVLLTKLFAPAYLNGAPAGLSYVIDTLELNKDGGSFAATNVAIAFNEKPFCDPLTDIAITVA